MFMHLRNYNYTLNLWGQKYLEYVPHIIKKIKNNQEIHFD